MLNIKEIALKVADSLRNKIDGISHMQSNQGLVAFAEALIAEIAKQNEPIAINEPNYHYEAMGCGLEDRGITDRYEAMEYGWNCAIERMFEQLPEDQLFTFPPTAEQIAKQNKPCAFLHEWIEHHAFGDIFAGVRCAAITSNEKPFDSSDTVSPLFTYPPTAEQIANETAEACAMVYLDTYDLTDIAEAIRSGAWRKFK